jgi:3',5'-cyclic AMP phosphodiesterase CpdA
VIGPPVTLPPVTLPPDADVWAVADVHGCALELDLALRGAGLTDAGGDWIAPPGTALVVIGDIIDRGPDPLVVLRRLHWLRRAAVAAGGHVALLEGNHEEMARAALAGDDGTWATWIMVGGAETVRAAGANPASRAARDTVLERAPDLVAMLRELAPYARWRDACFVHAGLVPGLDDLDDLAATSARLWRHGDFLWGPPFPDAPAWRAYREAGIGRVVVGHKGVGAPTLLHDGRVLMIDTRAGHPVPGSAVSLVHLPDDGLEPLEVIRVPRVPRPVPEGNGGPPR